MNVSGVDEVFYQLTHAGQRVSDGARKKMHAGAARIVKEARLNAPRDDGELEDSIRIEKDYGFRGRLQLNIVMGGFVRGVNVDSYAMEVHENYEGMGKPGANTLAKMAANPGRYIGSKFLERAAAKEEPRLNADIIDVTKKEWHL